LKKKDPQIFHSFVRTAIKGGPGYTRFGHGRYKANLSRYAYFYYAFLFGGLTLVLFLDPEKLTWDGQEADQKLKDMKNLYSRDTVPRAKEVTTEEKNTNDEKELMNSGNQEDSESIKKSKKSFRNRKVKFLD